MPGFNPQSGQFLRLLQVHGPWVTNPEAVTITFGCSSLHSLQYPNHARTHSLQYIYAQFPKVVWLNTVLDLSPTNWVWKQCLTFPVNKLNRLQLPLRPYKWIRYATGIVVGARGQLGQERDTPTRIEYNDALPAKSISLYYHTTDQVKLSMFPIDPKLADSRTVASKGSSLRRAGFRSDVQG